MATTRIIPMHLNKGKSLAQCLTDRMYGMNPEKTDGGKLISSFACERRPWFPNLPFPNVSIGS